MREGEGRGGPRWTERAWVRHHDRGGAWLRRGALSWRGRTRWQLGPHRPGGGPRERSTSNGAVSEEGVEAVRLMAGGKSKARGTSACVAERPNPAKPERPDGHPPPKNWPAPLLSPFPAKAGLPLADSALSGGARRLESLPRRGTMADHTPHHLTIRCTMVGIYGGCVARGIPG